MQAPMEPRLEFMLIIQSHATPSRENDVWLRRFACVNNACETECRTILTSPEWTTWREAQIKSDVEIEIPDAVLIADNTAVLKLLNYYSNDPYTQARMIREIQSMLALRRTSPTTQIVFHTTPDSNDVDLVPTNIMQVACRILSSAKVSDFMLIEAYSSVFEYVVGGYDAQLRMHHGTGRCIAWKTIFVNVLTNVLCQLLKYDVLENMPSRKWVDFLADCAIGFLRDLMQGVIDDDYGFCPHMYEGELLRTFCMLYPKITTTLCVCMRIINRNSSVDASITFDLVRTYADLLTHVAASIEKVAIPITVAIPDICQLLDSVEEAAEENIQNCFAKIGVSPIKLWVEYRNFLQQIYRFRKQNGLGHVDSARQIVPIIVEEFLAHELMGDCLAWLSIIVDNEDDDNLCRFVVTQCMQHCGSQNMFDITAKVTFRNPDIKSDCYFAQFVDFIYCICTSKCASSRENVAIVSTTHALQVLMVALHVDLLKLQKPLMPWHNRESIQQTIFRAMYAIVEIISSVPSTTSTSLLYTSIQTRDPAIVAHIREKMTRDPSAYDRQYAQILRYHKGDFDEQSEHYTLRSPTDLHTDSQIAATMSDKLVHRHVTVVNLSALAIKAQESALPTLKALSERLLVLLV